MPLFGRRVARGDDVADDLRPGTVVRVRLQVDQRQRHFPFAQVAGDRLAHRFGVAGEVEQVVDDLERHAEVEAVFLERLLLIAGHLGQHAADLRAAAEEKGGLAAHDVEVLVLGNAGIAVLRQLVQLALDHVQGDVAQGADDFELVVRQRHRHRLDVQIVAEQHGDVVAPPRVHGQPPAAEVRVVDDVVVDERRGVDELDDGGVEDRPIAGVTDEARGHQQDRRPDPLAAAGPDVLPDLRDQRHFRLDVARELLVDLLKVGADRLEDLRQGQRRFFHVFYVQNFITA